MKSINKQNVPATVEQDINREFTEWKDGKCISLDEGKYKTLYIFHEEMERVNEEGETSVEVCAFPVRVEKPVTRDRAINAAEMEAYSLLSPMEVASYNAALSRKFRENPKNAEVKEHDEFIKRVKDELTGIGL